MRLFSQLNMKGQIHERNYRHTYSILNLLPANDHSRVQEASKLTGNNHVQSVAGLDFDRMGMGLDMEPDRER